MWDCVVDLLGEDAEPTTRERGARWYRLRNTWHTFLNQTYADGFPMR